MQNRGAYESVAPVDRSRSPTGIEATMFARMIVAIALVFTSGTAFASDRGAERHQAFDEKAQKIERRAPSPATSPAPSATPGPVLAACTCTK